MERRRYYVCLVIAFLGPVTIWMLYSFIPVSDYRQKFFTKDASPAEHNRPPTQHVPQIFCMIFTTPGSYQTKARAIKATWAQRCTGYAFFYSRQKDYDPLPDGFPLDIPEGREHLTAKVLAAIKISHRECQGRVDWFLKADDDTYVIMENLKHFLSKQDPNQALYIGGTSPDFLTHGYNGGGAGYVLSKESVRLMLELGDHFGCSLDGGFEDLEIGRCLAKFRVYPVETRDEEGRLTFHADHPLTLLDGNMVHWDAYTYTRGNITFGKSTGVRVLSPKTVTFHYINPAHMYMYDFLLYELERSNEFRTDRNR